MKYYVGIDLHSDNLYLGMIDQKGKRRFHSKARCDWEEILPMLNRHRKSIEIIAVESTYNWYWLVDGLRAEGYAVDLANPRQMRDYSGMKHRDGRDDAYWLAEMARPKSCPPDTSASRPPGRCEICCGGGWATCANARPSSWDSKDSLLVMWAAAQGEADFLGSRQRRSRGSSRKRPINSACSQASS